VSVETLNTPRRHRWFERTPKPVLDPVTGTERHDRVCEFCQVTRTTVIPPRGRVWIEWVTAAGVKSIDGPTPVCVPVEPKAVPA
jgi:hypothetical protein